MAQWKKIIVSGSNVSQLANDAGYISSLPANLFSGSAQVTLGGDLTGTAANAQIAAGAVGSTELASGAVTAAKLSGAIGLISSSAQLTDVVKTSGTQTIGGDKTFGDDVIISGDLTVNGATTVISTTNLSVEDRYIAIGTGTTSGGNGGIIVVSGSVASCRRPPRRPAASRRHGPGARARGGAAFGHAVGVKGARTVARLARRPSDRRACPRDAV